jgi:uracil-DNA glycosylase
MNHDKQTRLDQIAADIAHDNICPDLAKTATHMVPGEGNPDADVVFIGEAPGKNEDLTGRPFIGAAGKLLDELLASIDLKRDQVFITSILKYRPPNNRDPRPAEKAEFWPYLERQLEVIEPKIIVPLGRHGMENFVPGQTITEVHGKLVEGGRWPVLPLYHPAAALYNSSLRQTLFDDFLQLKNYLEEIKKRK